MKKRAKSEENKNSDIKENTEKKSMKQLLSLKDVVVDKNK